MKQHNIIILLISISLLFTPIYTVSATEYKSDNGDLLKSLHANQQKIFEPDTNDVLLQSELNSLSYQVDEAMQQLQENDSKEQPYISTYGGSYIENNNLIVCVTENYDYSLPNNPKIKYKIVINSYNDLIKQKAEISSNYEFLYKKHLNSTTKENELLLSLCGIGIDEKNNCIIVDICDLTNEKINTFHDLFKNSQNIIFHEAEAPVQASANCKPGQAIYVITKKEGITIYYSRLSIGYRAYLKTSNGNKYGFTSCGHAIRTSIDNKVYTDTTFQTVLGTIKTWQYGDSVDASFIELSSGNNFVTTTYYSNENGSTSGGDSIKSNSVVKSLTIGATVYKVGSTTYKTSAIVTNTNYDFTLNGVAFTNFIKTTDFDTYNEKRAPLVPVFRGV